ncbi:hypothetical protein CS0771_07490 [Catellatospora sp. IY07-71]|uniref:hypothetical protein n=1 Tax=Catellatospora sp. IY07-71 TaxID=2728827 RepID=UPI001BB3D729|nr:hypothetical protein [Catellatospora sp. IY07-71]BCJ71205.1 hypothetical protein CS0771_07490 [Catellatospora sp. IY07-71]
MADPKFDTAARFYDIQVATSPGDVGKPSEDWVYADEQIAVVLDGATARTDTGCVHGVHWYAEHLGKAIVECAGEFEGLPLSGALRMAILTVALEHRNCDLDHPGTPSAGVAILRPSGDYLVLGDVTIVNDSAYELNIVVDPRVEQTAKAEREEVDRHLIGTAEKAQALIPMKRAELAARNKDGGYWIAAAEPAAARHALTGRIDAIGRVAILTDGAARAATLGLMSWRDLLARSVDQGGPRALIEAVRAAEAGDPKGARWPRNKASDDATVFSAWLAPPHLR